LYKKIISKTFCDVEQGSALLVNRSSRCCGFTRVSRLKLSKLGLYITFDRFATSQMNGFWFVHGCSKSKALPLSTPTATQFTPCCVFLGCPLFHFAFLTRRATEHQPNEEGQPLSVAEVQKVPAAPNRLPDAAAQTQIYTSIFINFKSPLLKVLMTPSYL